MVFPCRYCSGSTTWTLLSGSGGRSSFVCQNPVCGSSALGLPFQANGQPSDQSGTGRASGALVRIAARASARNSVRDTIRINPILRRFHQPPYRRVPGQPGSDRPSRESQILGLLRVHQIICRSNSLRGRRRESIRTTELHESLFNRFHRSQLRRLISTIRDREGSSISGSDLRSGVLFWYVMNYRNLESGISEAQLQAAQEFVNARRSNVPTAVTGHTTETSTVDPAVGNTQRSARSASLSRTAAQILGETLSYYRGSAVAQDETDLAHAMASASLEDSKDDKQ